MRAVHAVCAYSVRGVCVQCARCVRAVRAVRAYSARGVCVQCARYVRTVRAACVCSVHSVCVHVICTHVLIVGSTSSDVSVY